MKPLLPALAVSLAAASLAADVPAQYVLPASPEPHLVFATPVTTTLGTAFDVDLADVNEAGPPRDRGRGHVAARPRSR
ncbi:MAG TPA: hypothetical protein VFF36_07330, partial [Planctomycetota bacterium]|nr:hypothetical protein [Planctomycetota bacterium]